VVFKFWRERTTFQRHVSQSNTRAGKHKSELFELAIMKKIRLIGWTQLKIFRSLQPVQRTRNSEPISTVTPQASIPRHWKGKKPGKWDRSILFLYKSYYEKPQHKVERQEQHRHSILRHLPPSAELASPSRKFASPLLRCHWGRQ
jgi:hypothetical protein